MPTEIPHIPIDTIPDPTSTDLGDPDNVYPELQDITVGESVGPPVANRQPQALGMRTEAIRDVLNQLVDVVNSLNDNLLHRDGASVGSGMRGDLDMHDPIADVSFRILGLADGVEDDDAATVKQLNDVQAFLNGLIAGTSEFVKRDGSAPMLGNLDLDGFKVINLGAPLLASDGANKAYVQFALDVVKADYVKRDGSLPMLGPLSAGGFPIRDLPTTPPTDGGDAVSYAYLLAALNSYISIPTGVIMAWPKGPSTAGPYYSPPPGWLYCTGDAVSRTTYAKLFALIGTTYGVGDSSTTFNLPDLRGRVPLGQDDMGGTPANVVTDPDASVMGAKLGTATVTLTAGQLPEHTHDYSDAYNSVTPGGTFLGPGTAVSGKTQATIAKSTSIAGNGEAHPNIQPSMTMAYLIKV